MPGTVRQTPDAASRLTSPMQHRHGSGSDPSLFCSSPDCSSCCLRRGRCVIEEQVACHMTLSALQNCLTDCEQEGYRFRHLLRESRDALPGMKFLQTTG